MKTDDINAIWIDIERQKNDRKKQLQRLVYIDLLYRAYIGSTGIPSKRFLSMEIPESESKSFDSFSVPMGFTLSIGAPSVKHEGYTACVLQAASADQNDIFTIVAKDILEELQKQGEASLYIDALKRRIEKWRQFFKNPAMHKLSEETVIGLIGELSFILDLHNAGISDVPDFWNGPIKAAQDFQGNSVAMEVKTSASNKLDYVHISSEVQLEYSQVEALFLVVYRVERNDANGITLPVLIDKVETVLNDAQKSRFKANLTCIGYNETDSALYKKGYSVKERKIYRVGDAFPHIERSSLPGGVVDVKYKVLLQNCESFEVSIEDLVDDVMEFEYGKD